MNGMRFGLAEWNSCVTPMALFGKTVPAFEFSATAWRATDLRMGQARLISVRPDQTGPPGEGARVRYHRYQGERGLVAAPWGYEDDYLNAVGRLWNLPLYRLMQEAVDGSVYLLECSRDLGKFLAWDAFARGDSQTKRFWWEMRKPGENGWVLCEAPSLPAPRPSLADADFDLVFGCPDLEFYRKIRKLRSLLP